LRSCLFIGWVLVTKIRQGIRAAQDVFYQPFTELAHAKDNKQAVNKGR